jgi:hypothetical protein
MPLPKLTLAPDQSGYTAGTAENEILSVKLDGGFSRYRRDQLRSTFNVDVQWTVGPVQYAYLRAFYRTAVNQAEEVFEIDLQADDPVMRTYEAHFVPGSFKLSAVTGNQYTVGASLEVKPITMESDVDEAFILAYEQDPTAFPNIESYLNFLATH